MGRKRDRDAAAARKWVPGSARNRPAERPAREWRKSNDECRSPSSSFDIWISSFARSGILAAACAVLVLSTLLAFRPALDKDFGFVNLDDNHYVYDNSHVTQGLTRESVAWAFTSLEFDNWHPLTWLSHMVDRQYFGEESLQNPWGYHLTSILLHTISVVVLFLVLVRMTSQPWPSFAVAVLFGIHPLRTESVAWISERKDVLSGLFFMLTLWAYAAYAMHRPGGKGDSPHLCAAPYGPFRQMGTVPFSAWVRYGLVIGLFALGLMAKPMLVTLPVLLLLLDYWPLRRLPGAGSRAQGAAKGRELRDESPGARKLSTLNRQLSTLNSPRSALGAPRSIFLPLIVEKLPLFVLSAASCAVTIIAQRGAMKVIDTITFRLRWQNALASCATYIGQIFCPIHLYPLYPFPEHGIPWPELVLAVVSLATITGIIVWLRAWRWLTVGWLWYLVTLLPVIGLVQVGVQARADRYTYLSHIGLYIMLAWTAEKLLAGLSIRSWVWAAALTLLVPILVESTAAQTRNWKDSEALWTSTLRANPDVALAHNNLGYIRESQQKFDEAFEHYRRAVEIRPRYVEGHINLGNIYMRRKEIDKAMEHYATAIDIRSDFELSYVRMADALMSRGNWTGAEANLRRALSIDPQYVVAHWMLGEALCQQRKFEDGIAEYRLAVRLSPGFSSGWTSLAQTLSYLGRNAEAQECYNRSR